MTSLPEWMHLSPVRFCGAALLLFAALLAVESKEARGWVSVMLATGTAMSLLLLG